MSLRERSRLAAMRHTQRIALSLFQEHGFDTTTTESIASAAGVATSTLYRHFGTKEALIVWDEHDRNVDKSIRRRLGTAPPLQALRDSFIEGLADRYAADLPFQLTRIRYIYATEALHAAAIEADFRARESLTEGLSQVLGPKDEGSAPLLAGAALLALDIAIDRWQQEDNADLAVMISAEFERLSGLSRFG